MDIKDVFGAQPRNVWEFLCENGQGLYIPPYQRQYSWDKSKINRLIEDICHGFHMLTKHEDSFTFLGTVIAIHDTNYATVSPIVKDEIPSKVMTIIDGQQRLTTLLLIITVLHEELKYRLQSCAGMTTPEYEWLRNKCKEVVSKLGKTFEEEQSYGDDNFTFYPRMVRAYEDSWSRSKQNAIYASPIGLYLHTYGNFSRNAPLGNSFDSKKYLQSDSNDQRYKQLIVGRDVIKKLIKQIAELGINDDLELPTISTIAKSRTLQETINKSSFPDTVVQLLLSEQHSTEFSQLLYLVLFANFLLERVALTIVTAKNEDYAFDMFESLNTTGEPLTAFETFKPKVIYGETLKAYGHSESKQYIEAIDHYFDIYTKNNEKQDATGRLIISFALAESGAKLSRRISDQRKYFKQTFDSLPTAEEKQNYIRHLLHTTWFYQYLWPDEKATPPEIYKVSDLDNDETKILLDVLRSMKHTVTIAPLIAFYSAILNADSDKKKRAINEFHTALKATVAFSILWRASRRSTEGIDAHYRKLMEVGSPSTNMPALARSKRKDAVSTIIDADTYRQALANILKVDGKIKNKSDWIKLASELPVYKNKHVARFLLLAAAHDSTIDTKDPGLTIKGRSGILPLLKYENWIDDKNQTIEHIAPQNAAADTWDNDLYENADTCDCLGNLTLLPKLENSSISNSTWDRKKLIYKILSAETNTDVVSLLKVAQSKNIKISMKANEILEQSKYLPLVRSVALVEKWTLALVVRRSQRISELAWDTIWPWLDPN